MKIRLRVSGSSLLVSWRLSGVSWLMMIFRLWKVIVIIWLVRFRSVMGLFVMKLRSSWRNLIVSCNVLVVLFCCDVYCVVVMWRIMIWVNIWLYGCLVYWLGCWCCFFWLCIFFDVCDVLLMKMGWWLKLVVGFFVCVCDMWCVVFILLCLLLFWRCFVYCLCWNVGWLFSVVLFGWMCVCVWWICRMILVCCVWLCCCCGCGICVWWYLCDRLFGICGLSVSVWFLVLLVGFLFFCCWIVWICWWCGWLYGWMYCFWLWFMLFLLILLVVFCSWVCLVYCVGVWMCWWFLVVVCVWFWVIVSFCVWFFIVVWWLLVIVGCVMNWWCLLLFVGIFLRSVLDVVCWWKIVWFCLVCFYVYMCGLLCWVCWVGNGCLGGSWVDVGCVWMLFCLVVVCLCVVSVLCVVCCGWNRLSCCFWLFWLCMCGCLLNVWVVFWIVLCLLFVWFLCVLWCCFFIFWGWLVCLGLRIGCWFLFVLVVLLVSCWYLDCVLGFLFWGICW